jgi:predicted RND superfamily exporter protein
LFEWIASAFARFTTRRPWLAVSAVIVVAVALSAMGRPEMSNDNAEFAPNDPAIAAADRIETLFGSDAAVTPLQFVFVSETGDVISTEGLEAATGVAAAIEATEIDGVRLADLLVSQPGSGPITSFMTPVQLAVANGAPVPTSDAEVKALLGASLAQAPAEQSQLLAQLIEGDVTSGAVSAPSGLMVTFFEAPADADEAALLADLQAELATTVEASISGDVTALPFSVELIAASGEESAIEIPLLIFGAIGIIGLVLLLVYFPGAGMGRLQRVRRTFADTLITLLVVVLAITSADGAAVLLGPGGLGLIGDISGAGSIVPILIVALGVDYVIHLNAAYRSGLSSGEGVQKAMARSVRIVGGALILSVLTTSFGFLTNLFSGTPSLLTFGVLATIGIVAAFIYANLLFPASRVLLDRRAARKDRLPAEAFASGDASWVDRILGATAVIPRRAPWAAVGVAGIVLLAGILTATNLRSGFSFLDFVPEGSAVRTAAVELTDRFDGGLGETTQVLVDADVTDPAVWNETLAATAAAGSFADVVTVNAQALVQSPQQLVASLVDPASAAFSPEVANAVVATGLDASLQAPPDADIAGLLDAVRAVVPDELAGVVAPSAALYTFTTQAGTDGAPQLAADLETAFGSTSIATSQEIISAAVVASISTTQVQSLVLALVGAALLLMLNFFVADRRPVLGLLTVLPVGGVVILLYAFMVIAGIEFGPVTATLAAVVIGFGVDSTIHVTHRFEEFRREGLDVDRAITQTLGTTGSALVASAVTTSLGFALLTQSSLIPFQQLGALIPAAVIGSALVSVLVLPSMLVIWARRSERPSEQPQAEAIPLVGANQSQA